MTETLAPLTAPIAYKKALPPIKDLIQQKVKYMGKDWTRLERLAHFLERIKYAFESQEPHPKASNIKEIKKNISVLNRDLKYLTKSLNIDHLDQKTFKLGHKRIREMKDCCVFLKAQAANKVEIELLNTFDQQIDEVANILDQIDPARQIQGFLRNTKKAIEEHRLKHEEDREVYATLAEGLPKINLKASPCLPRLGFSTTSAEAQGYHRPTMEDACFSKKGLWGVFDGHGGKDVSEYACAEFQKRFFPMLKKSQGDVRWTFESLINEIHQEIAKRHEWDSQGSTAVICYLDPETNLIYTATLADSEANIYRKGKSIPLSCVRDWSSLKDATRVAEAKKDPSIAKTWPKQDPKRLRFPGENNGFNYGGLNVSRAFGDMGHVEFAHVMGYKGDIISHKPKITVNQAEDGDVIVLACDGLKDYVAEKEINTIVQKEQASGKNIAKALVHHAIDVNDAWDNVSVIAIVVSKKSNEKNGPVES